MNGYKYSPLTREELVMVAYNAIAPTEISRMTIQEAVEIVEQNTPMIPCLEKLVRSDETSITTIKGMPFKCKIYSSIADLSQLEKVNEILPMLEKAKKDLHKGFYFLKESGIADLIEDPRKEV